MADEIVTGLAGIKKELKAVQDQMIGLSAGSDEFVKLSQKAGELKDRMKDVKEAVNSQAGPAIANLGSNAQVARGQLMELDLEGFSESLKRVGSNVKSIDMDMLTGGLKSSAGAFKDLALSILGNPILVIGGTIALVITYWDELNNVIGEATKRDKEYSQQVADTAKAMSGEVMILEKAKNKLNDVNITQQQRTQIVQDLQKQFPAYLGNINAETVSHEQLQVALSNVNKALLLKYEIQAREKLLQPIMEKKIELQIKYQNQLKEEYENQKALEEDAKKGTRAEQIEKQREVEILRSRHVNLGAQTEKEIADLDKQINGIIADIGKSQYELDKYVTKSNVSNADHTVKTEKETTKKVKQEKIDRNKILTQFNEEQADADIILAEEVAKKNAAQSQALTDKERANAIELHGEKKSLVADLNEVEKEAFNTRMERSDIETQHQIENEKKLRDAKFAARDAALKLAKEGEEAIANVGAAYFATKMSRIDRETKEGAAAYEVLAKKQFEFNKKMQLAGAIIDLARGINSSLAAAPVAIGPAPNPAGIASLAFVTATGLANIAKIAATKYQSSTSPSGTQPSPNLSGGGGGGQSPAALNLSAIQGNTNTAPIQSYVLAGQVSSAQQAEFKIKNTASILGGG